MVVQTELRASQVDGITEEQIFADIQNKPILVPVFREIQELVATLDGLEPVLTRVLIGYREETNE